MSVANATQRRRRDELIWSVTRVTTVADVFAEASGRFQGLVPFDGAAWLMTDPATGLPASLVRMDGIESIDADHCTEHWRREFLVDDINLFRDLARADVPAGSLASAVDDPMHSPRFRSFVQPLGFGDELRVVLRTGVDPWGVVTLWRHPDRPAFSQREVRLVAGLSVPLAEAIKAQARDGQVLAGHPPADRPGLLLFDAAGELRSIDTQGRAWLDELPDDHRLPTGLGVNLPIWISITAIEAAADRRHGGDGAARSRARSRRGGWLACHASCQPDAAGAVGPTVVAIERARPAEVASIVSHVYGLTDRERQIVGMIARGAGTREIAAQLYISLHTVRDHVKAIFAKVRVSTRGELVATLFAEFYAPAHDPTTGQDTNKLRDHC